jgi:hypothetical protein
MARRTFTIQIETAEDVNEYRALAYLLTRLTAKVIDNHPEEPIDTQIHSLMGTASVVDTTPSAYIPDENVPNPPF